MECIGQQYIISNKERSRAGKTKLLSKSSVEVRWCIMWCLHGQRQELGDREESAVPVTDEGEEEKS